MRECVCVLHDLSECWLCLNIFPGLPLLSSLSLRKSVVGTLLASDNCNTLSAQLTGDMVTTYVHIHYTVVS